jgi:NAD(P)-dependent dehydrogenase (short-subunit alcohol dehydrogenase family)
MTSAWEDESAAAHAHPRVALVTGGSRGIGAQIVSELVSAGTRVCLTSATLGTPGEYIPYAAAKVG